MDLSLFYQEYSKRYKKVNSNQGFYFSTSISQESELTRSKFDIGVKESIHHISFQNYFGGPQYVHCYLLDIEISLSPKNYNNEKLLLFYN